MGTLGYAAMFEQFHPTDLLRWSRQAEDLGFGSVMASDHFHPWTPAQGQAAFVWGSERPRSAAGARLAHRRARYALGQG